MGDNIIPSHVAQALIDIFKSAIVQVVQANGGHVAAIGADALLGALEALATPNLETDAPPSPAAPDAETLAQAVNAYVAVHGSLPPGIGAAPPGVVS